MRNEYLKNQNLFHRPFVTLIQKNYRGHTCRLVAHQLVLNRAAYLVQKRWATYKIVKKCKAIAHDLKIIKVAKQELNLLQIKSVNLIMKYFRGVRQPFYFILFILFILFYLFYFTCSI